MSDLNVSSDAAAPAWRERKNLLLGGAVGVAVLLFVAYFLVFSGGSSSEDTGLVVSGKDRISASGGGAGATPKASASASPTTATTLPATFDEDIYGDPFAPIYAPAPTAAPSTAAAPVVAPVAPVDTSDSAPVEEVVPSAKATSTSVRLVRVIDQETVVVTTDGSKSESIFKIGTPFGSFVLVSTRPDEDEATFNFGDGSPFTLVEGQSKKFSL